MYRWLWIGLLFMGHAASGQDSGLALYIAPEYGRSEPHALHYFLPSQVSGTPFLTDEAFVGFHVESLTLLLTPDAKQSLQQLEVPFEGLPLVLTLHGKPLVGFWAWPVSLARPCTWLAIRLVDEGIRLQQGIPNSVFESNRFTEAWIDVIVVYFEHKE